MFSLISQKIDSSEKDHLTKLEKFYPGKDGFNQWAVEESKKKNGGAGEKKDPLRDPEEAKLFDSLDSSDYTYPLSSKELKYGSENLQVIKYLHNSFINSN